jgi:hypothetical protein
MPTDYKKKYLELKVESEKLLKEFEHLQKLNVELYLDYRELQRRLALIRNIVS